MPNLPFATWLTAQGLRADSVGALSRMWADESAKDFAAWIDARKQGVVLESAIYQAELEYGETVKSLAAGESSPTFPKFFLRESFVKAMSNSFSFHKEYPDISTDDYLDLRHSKLQAAFSGRTIIYIDTCHWIKMRHVTLNDSRRSDEYAKVLTALLSLRRAKKILCPISLPLFVELMKQSDPKTCRATARLMDFFSHGICLQNMQDIVRLEIDTEIARAVHQERAKDLSAWVWTKAGFIAGELLPEPSDFEEDSKHVMQKAFIDMLWALRLEDVVDDLKGESFPNRDDAAFSAACNADADRYRANRMRFPEILEHELAFAFRSARDYFDSSLAEIYEKYQEECDSATARGSLNRKPDAYVLPSLQIKAGISASSFASGAKFKPNDLADAEHATLSLPYCDIFFCDAPLAHRLTTKPLAFDKRYETAVLSKPADFLSALANIA